MAASSLECWLGDVRSGHAGVETTLRLALFEVLLEVVDAALFVVRADGHVVLTNGHGHELIASHEEAVLSLLETVTKASPESSSSSMAAVSSSTSTLRARRRWFLAGRAPYALVVVESPEVQLDWIPRTWRLTARQEKVFRLVLEGLSNKEIADALGMSARTVEVHTRALFAKANVDSRARLIAKTWNLYRRGDEQGPKIGAASSKRGRG